MPWPFALGWWLGNGIADYWFQHRAALAPKQDYFPGFQLAEGPCPGDPEMFSLLGMNPGCPGPEPFFPEEFPYTPGLDQSFVRWDRIDANSVVAVDVWAEVVPGSGDWPGASPVPDGNPSGRPVTDAENDKRLGQARFVDPMIAPVGDPFPAPYALPWHLLAKRPLNNPLRYPWREVGPKPVVEPAPVRHVTVISARAHREFVERANPRRRGRTFEKKFRATLHGGSKLGLLVSGASELKDFLDCAHQALHETAPPYMAKKGGRIVEQAKYRKPFSRSQMLEDLWNGRENLGVDWFRKTTQCMMVELLKDAVYGTFGRVGAAAVQANKYWSRPVGFQSGQGFWPTRSFNI